MSAVGDLLPPESSGPYETAAAAAMSDALPVPIRAAVDPALSPVPFLPFLAAHDGARLWFPDWATARKRLVISQSLVANGEVGTRAGTIRYLAYVDATLIDAIVYPSRFVAGRSAIGRRPIGHPDFTARYLIKIVTHKAANAFVFGRSALASRPLKTSNYTPFKRGFAALRAAKGPETQYRVDYAHKRVITVGDAVALDGAHRVGDFIDRTRL